MDLHTYLNRRFPLLGRDLPPDAYCRISLDRAHTPLQTYDTSTYAGLEAYLQQVLHRAGARVAVGGYAENRSLYESSPHYDGRRSIHLGVDLWAPAGTPVYAPLPGRVHSLAYNDAPLDYGATVIVEHDGPEGPLYSLYGHLSRADLSKNRPGQVLAAGQVFCRLGKPEENGGWVPHLHVQLIRDLEGMRGDYPGVAVPEEAKRYLQNCPDPSILAWP
jgi:murein DD-endopeptidase MepM/ murein hydrolase activator NlpD